MSEQNKQTVRHVRGAINDRNLALLDGHYADNYVYHGIPSVGELHGLEAFKEMVTGFLDGQEGFRETVEDQVAENDRVVTRMKGSGRHTGELMGVPATGKDLSWTLIIISRFEDGKIAEEWCEFDALSFLQQVGAVPSPG